METVGSNVNYNDAKMETVLQDYHVINGPEPPINDTNSMHKSNSSDNLANVAVGSTSKHDTGCAVSTQGKMAVPGEASSDNQCSPALVFTCPRVDCPEKIIICLDLNDEMSKTTFRSRAGDRYSGLDLAIRAVKMFVMHKTQMNSKHEFALLVFKEEATMIQPLTSKAQEIMRTLDMDQIETQESGPADLAKIFETVEDVVDLPNVEGDPSVVPPPYVVRLMVIFGRSHSPPTASSHQAQKRLEASPYFFTDVLYIHEPPSEENQCEDIFPMLCDLDHNGLSYIFELSKYTPILNSGAKLLAHPLQRPRQQDASYKIGNLVPTVAQIPRVSPTFGPLE